MIPSSSQIYVRFVDGTDVMIPVNGRPVSENVYELMPHDEFDYHDEVILFQYGAGDIVEVVTIQFEGGHQGLLADRLVGCGNARNTYKRILYCILHDNPELNELVSTFDKKEVLRICEAASESHVVYPAIQDWLNTHRQALKEMRQQNGAT